MKYAECHLKSVSPYSSSRPYDYETPKRSDETYEEYEERTWREKSHSMPDGQIFQPPMGYKQALDAAASMLRMKVKEKGTSTFTKFFLSGIICAEPVLLDTTKDKLECDRIFANADGVRGSGKRVWRNFPRVDKWSAVLVVGVMADEISKAVFETHLKQAGSFVGVGRFRPQKGGFYGRFQTVKVVWS